MSTRVTSHLTTVDWFVLFNSALLGLMAGTVYWHRFLAFKPRANWPEFAAYAGALFACIAVAWVRMRRRPVRLGVLVAVELGLLLHFAAGLVFQGSTRLYDLQLGIDWFGYPLRLDKVVHAFNAYVGFALALELLRVLGIPLVRGRMLVATLVVLGAGSLIEMVEYVVVKTIPHNGVGDYDNNMTDLLANLLGCLLFVATQALLTASRRRSRFWGVWEEAESETPTVARLR